MFSTEEKWNTRQVSSLETSSLGNMVSAKVKAFYESEFHYHLVMLGDMRRGSSLFSYQSSFPAPDNSMICFKMI